MTLEAVHELFKCGLPFLFSHEHFASTLFDDTDDTRILDRGGEVLTQAEDCFHSSLLLQLNAHLDLKGEDLEKHAAFSKVEELLSREVASGSRVFSVQSGCCICSETGSL